MLSPAPRSNTVTRSSAVSPVPKISLLLYLDFQDPPLKFKYALALSLILFSLFFIIELAENLPAFRTHSFRLISAWANENFDIVKPYGIVTRPGAENEVQGVYPFRHGKPHKLRAPAFLIRRVSR